MCAHTFRMSHYNYGERVSERKTEIERERVGKRACLPFCLATRTISTIKICTHILIALGRATTYTNRPPNRPTDYTGTHWDPVRPPALPLQARVDRLPDVARLALHLAAPVERARAPLHHDHLLRSIPATAAHQVAAIDADRGVVALASVRTLDAQP